MHSYFFVYRGCYRHTFYKWNAVMEGTTRLMETYSENDLARDPKHLEQLEKFDNSYRNSVTSVFNVNAIITE